MVTYIRHFVTTDTTIKKTNKNPMPEAFKNKLNRNKNAKIKNTIPSVQNIIRTRTGLIRRVRLSNRHIPNASSPTILNSNT